MPLTRELGDFVAALSFAGGARIALLPGPEAENYHLGALKPMQPPGAFPAMRPAPRFCSMLGHILDSLIG